jgi:hypothetical protein
VVLSYTSGGDPLKQQLKLKHCWICHTDTNSLACCGHKTQPNSWIKRFPRESDEYIAAMKAKCTTPNEDAWQKRPQQMGLVSPR